MAIFVKHLTTGNEYVLIGTVSSSQQGLNLSNIPFFGSRINQEDSEASPYWLVLCDQNGEIFWLPVKETVVTEIDGKTPEDLLENKVTSPLKNSLGDEPSITINSEVKTDEDLDDEDEDWI